MFMIITGGYMHLPVVITVQLYITTTTADDVADDHESKQSELEHRYLHITSNCQMTSIVHELKVGIEVKSSFFFSLSPSLFYTAATTSNNSW